VPFQHLIYYFILVLITHSLMFKLYQSGDNIATLFLFSGLDSTKMILFLSLVYFLNQISTHSANCTFTLNKSLAYGEPWQGH
jgi:hypothetical protein